MRAQSIQKLFTFSVILSIALITLTLVGSKRVSALDDFCTWTGAGGNANYSNANNWSGCDNGHLPEGGDTIILPSGPTNKTITLDGSVALRNLQVSGDGYLIQPASLGDVLLIQNSADFSGDNNIVTALTYYISSSDTYLTSSGSGNEFQNVIALQPTAGGTKFNVDVSGDIAIQNISDAGGTYVDSVVKTGGGTVIITGGSIVNGFHSDNGLDITAGTWRCNNDRCVGMDTNTVTIEEDGTTPALLELNDANVNIENPISISSTSGNPVAIRATDDATISGTINISGDSAIANDSSNGSVTLNNIISGTGNVTFTGNSSALVDFVLDGSSPNTYDGTMIVDQGFIRFDKNGAVPGGLTVTAHPSEYSGALHGSGITNAISDTGTVTLTNNGTNVASLDLDGSETIGGLVGNGAIDEQTDTLVLNGSGNYEFTGDINVDTITKSGTGTQIFNNIDAQTINVTAGNLIIKGTTTATTTIGSGSVLKGYGPVGTTIISGTLAPGLSPGTMTVNGNLDLTNGTYQAELNGTVAGTGYDQAVVSGTTTLSNTTLSASLGFVPAAGNTFTILRSAVISGTFNGLTDNATITVSGVLMRINYNLNASGEDTVTLTVLSLASTPNTGIQAQNALSLVAPLLCGSLLLVAAVKKSAKK